MKYPVQVPEPKKIRLIINTDAKNEADDQYAIVQALLTNRFIIKSIMAAHFGQQKSLTSLEDSYKEIEKVIGLMELNRGVPISKGATHALPDENTPIDSEGARLIVEEALKDDPHPLFICFLGPLTDMASAYLLEPKIAKRLTCIWIGGASYNPSHPLGIKEYNLNNDLHAANVVFKSDIPVWQIPMDVYTMMRVSLSELERRVRPYGKIGHYLVQQLIDMNNAWGNNPRWPQGESWSLGDSPAIGVLIDEQIFNSSMLQAPSFNPDCSYNLDNPGRPIRVYNSIDARFILEDFYAKLELNYLNTTNMKI